VPESGENWFAGVRIPQPHHWEQIPVVRHALIVIVHAFNREVVVARTLAATDGPIQHRRRRWWPRLPKSERFNTAAGSSPGMSQSGRSKVLESCAVVVSSAGATPELNRRHRALNVERNWQRTVCSDSTLNPLMTVVAKLVEDAETLYVPTASC